MACHSNEPLNCFCGRTYTDPVDLEEHRRARGHFPSHVCRSSCNHPSVGKYTFQTHKCGACNRVFNRLDILRDHRIATGHCFCSECNSAFESESALKIHRKTKVHASEFRCCDCDISLKDIHALKAHMASPVHRKPTDKNAHQKSTKSTQAVTSSNERTCKPCQKTFKSAEALQQHCESLKHKPLSTLGCPVGKECRGNFSAPSALLHHLESGKCKSGMDRDDFYHMVQLCDKERRIHNVPTFTPSSSTSRSAVSLSPRLDPSTSLETPNEWQIVSATLSPSHAIWNWVDSSTPEGIVLPIKETSLEGAAVVPVLRCPLCPNTHKGFSTAQALQQHMESPVHSEKLYHCPTDLIPKGPSGTKKKGDTEKHFTTLGGLAQHLESGACYGGKQTFLYCVDLIQRQLEQVGLGGIRLLLPGCRS